MEPPVISRKQAKKTLSAKKKKTEVIKNVLAKPYQNYWPLLSLEDNKQLTEVLEKHLPRLKHNKVNVPYEQIKSVPKADRKNFREGLIKQPPLESGESDRQVLVLGVNAVSKLLENCEAGSVMVASDVKPRLLVQHIIDQAVLYNVPVVVVEKIRDTFKNKCGLSGATVALKKTVKPDSHLGVIQQTICNIYENYPVPQDHINYHRRVNSDSVITILDSENEESLHDSDDGVEEIKNYHLKRTNKTRVFVPRKTGITVKMPDFVKFDTSTPVNNTVKVVTDYRPLTVKRLKGDKNRNKRKMNKLKKNKAK